MKKIFNNIICSVLIVLFLLCAGCTSPKRHDYLRLEREDWADDVKKGLNDFLEIYGKGGEKYSRDSYVVFDFDNTTAIFDVEVQLCSYQLEVMAFNILPEDMRSVLLSGLKNTDKDLTYVGYGNGSLNDWVEDISKAYEKLWEKYGPFDADGIDKEKQSQIKSDSWWKEFATKMKVLYSLIFAAQSADAAYSWVINWFASMTNKEVYDLAKRCYEIYGEVETYSETWSSPKNIDSKVGQVSTKVTMGVSVTENMKELWRAISDNQIDIWVNSASCIDAVAAAIDVFGLHDYCKGLVALTNKTKDGRYLPVYDYETGYGYLAQKDGSWINTELTTKTQTQGKGKVTAIVNAIAPMYDDRGPIAGFMDSTGDFNFCTEFKTLKLVVCFNRANRKVTDGGGLIAELAIYQRDTLMYDLEKANEEDDTLYLLQGRNENGKRTFINSNMTIVFGKEEKVLFRNSDNEAQLHKMIEDDMTTKEILEKWSIKQSSGENGFSFDTGFLSEYAGYHSHR